MFVLLCNSCSGKYGWPRFNLSLIVGLLAGFMASIVESVGDYYACASMAGAPPPPRHAINRGTADCYLDIHIYVIVYRHDYIDSFKVRIWYI